MALLCNKSSLGFIERAASSKQVSNSKRTTTGINRIIEIELVEI